EHQPVPRGDRLVVASGLWAPLSGLEELRTLLVRQLAADHEAAMLERLQQLVRTRHFVGCPGERQPLDPVRVRILRRREAAGVEPELAEGVLDRVRDDPAIALVAR